MRRDPYALTRLVVLLRTLYNKTVAEFSAEHAVGEHLAVGGGADRDGFWGVYVGEFCRGLTCG